MAHVGARLQARQNALFWDPDEGGWFSTTGADPAVLLRLKEDYDGAEPAASSVSVMNELHLAYLLDDDEARQRAARTLARYGPRAGRAARVIPLMLAGLSAWHAGLGQVVVVGDPTDAATRLLSAELAKHYLPFVVVIPLVPGAAAEALARMIPLVGPWPPGDPAAFVCQDFVCREPCDAGGTGRASGASPMTPPLSVAFNDERTRAAFRFFHATGNIITADIVRALTDALSTAEEIRISN